MKLAARGYCDSNFDVDECYLRIAMFLVSIWYGNLSIWGFSP